MGFRKKLVVVGMFLGLAAPGFAAEVGVVGGLNLSGVSFSIPSGSSIASGTALASSTTSTLLYGVTTYWSLAPHFLLGLDALWMNLGFATDDANLVNGKTEFSSNNVVVPLTLNLDVVSQYLRVGIGGYAAFGVCDYTQRVVSSGTTIALTRQNRYGSFNFGAVGGVQLGYPLLPAVRILADARYYFGLSNLYAGSNANTVTGNVRNLVFMVGASVGF